VPPGPNQPTLVARGNMVPVDHGESIGEEVVLPELKPGRRRVIIPLREGSVTQAIPFDPEAATSDLLRGDTGRARAAIAAFQRGADGSLVPWEIRSDLLD